MSRINRWEGKKQSRAARIEFGKKFRDLRQKNMLSQEKLAEKLDVSIDLINRIECGYVDFNFNEYAPSLAKRINDFIEGKREVIRI